MQLLLLFTAPVRRFVIIELSCRELSLLPALKRMAPTSKTARPCQGQLPPHNAIDIPKSQAFQHVLNETESQLVICGPNFTAEEEHSEHERRRHVQLFSLPPSLIPGVKSNDMLSD